MKKKQKNKPTPKANVKKAVFIGLGVAAVGAGAFFGWRYFSNRNSARYSEDDVVPYTEPEETSTTPSSSGSSYTPKPTSEFPIKRGSRGEKVKMIQNALIARYGASILPKYGADGDFGSELENALVKNGWPTVIDENAFNVLAKSSSVDAGSVALSLYKAVLAKDYSSALSSIRKIKNVSDYSSVSEKFKTYYIGGVRYTVVNAVLTKFTDASQKETFRKEFLRIGLKYDGSKWALAGLDGMPYVITVHPTTVWAYPNQRIQVDVNVVLGFPIESKNGYTLFLTPDRKHKLLVKTNSVLIKR
jgi:hypothetical protein